MARTPAAAVAVAKSYSYYSPPGMCQQFTRVCFGVGAYFGSARLAWLGAKKRHYVDRGSEVPAGVPVYWLGGSRGFGHAAVSLGGGYCRSTDWPSSGRVGTARIDDVTRAFNQTLVGWTEDINGSVIPGAAALAANPKRVIDASEVRKAIRKPARVRNAIALKHAVAKEVGRGRLNLASPKIGRHFRGKYREVQEKYLRSQGLRVTKAAADGIPGTASLQWLAKRHGLTITP